MKTTSANQINWIESVNELPPGLGWYGLQKVSENNGHENFGLALGKVNGLTLIFAISLDENGIALISNKEHVGFPFITEIQPIQEVGINNLNESIISTVEIKSNYSKISFVEEAPLTEPLLVEQKNTLSKIYVKKMEAKANDFHSDITESIVFEFNKLLSVMAKHSGDIPIRDKGYGLKITPLLIDETIVDKTLKQNKKGNQTKMDYLNRITYAIEVMDGDKEVPGSLHDFGKLCPPNCRPPKTNN